MRDGPGKLVERLYREVRAFAIPGGSEEVRIGGRLTHRGFHLVMGVPLTIAGWFISWKIPETG